MKAIINIQGKQFLVKQGNILKVNHFQDKYPGDLIVFNKILLVTNEKNDNKIGTPYLRGVLVYSILLENKKGKKIYILKKNRRKGYQKKIGYREHLSIIKVFSINNLK